MARVPLLPRQGASSYYKVAHVAYTGTAQAAYTPATYARTASRELKYGGEDFVLARAQEIGSTFAATWGIAESSQTGPTFNAIRSRGGGRGDPETGKAEQLPAERGEARAWLGVVGPGVARAKLERNEGVTDRAANMFYFGQRLLEMLEQCLLEQTATAPAARL